MTKTVINKDLDLKLLCKVLFEKMGFCTHFEVQLRTKSYIKAFQTHDISDIDVYGYKFNSDLSQFTIGSECKSGETGALEELFKFLGIVDYYNLDRGYLIKSRIHQNAREVASRNKIRCLTESEIRQILLGFDLDIEKLLKIEHIKHSRYQDALKHYSKINDKLVDYITLDYWNRENWKNIHNLMHVLNTPVQSEMFEETKVKAKEKLIFYTITELFSVAVLRMISDAMVLNYSDITKSIVNMLYGGAESLNERRKIHDLVSQATQTDNSFEPLWQDDLINICVRFSQHTSASSQIPQLIQLLRNESFYPNDVRIKKNQIDQFPDLTRKYTQDLMHFIQNRCNIDSNIFEEFMVL